MTGLLPLLLLISICSIQADMGKGIGSCRNQKGNCIPKGRNCLNVSKAKCSAGQICCVAEVKVKKSKKREIEGIKEKAILLREGGGEKKKCKKKKGSCKESCDVGEVPIHKGCKGKDSTCCAPPKPCKIKKKCKNKNGSCKEYCGFDEIEIPKGCKGKGCTCCVLCKENKQSTENGGCSRRGYYGVKIGDLSQLHHEVMGEVFAVDSRTIHIRDFSYDGTAPDAFFYAGTSGQPSDQGYIIPDEKGTTNVLGAYNNKHITLTLPDGQTLEDIAWFSVWCREFTIDFGHVMIPNGFTYPRPQTIDAFPTFEHEVSSDRIVVEDAQTFRIPNFNYDGKGPDAYFWVGKGSGPGPSGNIVPDENGAEQPLKKYTSKTIVITLPGDQTVFDIDFLSVWCRDFKVDFSHVRIPKNLNIPPSLKMLGVTPQRR